MELPIQLIVKVQQFDDKRIEAKASWNIKELKGKLSEIYATSTEEQKLIYSGKLLSDSVILKDVLREYEGQEAHTVHLVFTPKSSRQSKQEAQVPRQSSSTSGSLPNMSTSELRQRHAPNTSTATPSATDPQTQQSNQMNIPSNYFNAFYGTVPGDANNLLAQQYAMQSWMQQAYTQYMNQYMNLLQSPEAFYQMNQQQQSQQPQNFAFISNQGPFPASPVAQAVDNDAAVPHNDVQPAEPVAAEPQQRRFPNIIQDEVQERDWLDILYSFSRLMILLCLVYFYSSPIRCLVVILIAISIYLYHIYKQNQARLNNNNTARVNLNLERQAPPAAEAPENAANVDTEAGNEAEPSATEPTADEPEVTIQHEPEVPFSTIVRTFVLSFFSSIIPEAPAL